MNFKAESSVEWTDHLEHSFFLPNFCQKQPVFILVIVAELLAVLLVLAQETAFDRLHFWYQLALLSFYIQWVSLTSAAMLCVLRKRLMGGSSYRAALISYGLIIADTMLVSLLGQILLSWIYADIPVSGWLVFKHGVMSAIIGGLVLRYFYVQQQLQSQQRAGLMHRIQALQSRIHPHFLFNSMNSIASLIASEPKLAETAVEDLAELFRASLHHVGDQVALSDELALCRRYIALEQLRLSDRLVVDWQIDAGVPLDARIPLLTLQPLLENAIYHGIQPLPQGGHISVVIEYQMPLLSLRVSNPYVVQKINHHKGHHMALDNIRHRLIALYGDQAHCDWRATRGQFEVCIEYPVMRTDLSKIG